MLPLPQDPQKFAHFQIFGRKMGHRRKIDIQTQDHARAVKYPPTPRSGKVGARNASEEGYGVNMAVGAFRTRQLLTIIAREFSARWSCGLDLELDKFLRQRRLMAQEQIWRYYCTRDDHHLSRLINPLEILDLHDASFDLF